MKIHMHCLSVGALSVLCATGGCGTDDPATTSALGGGSPSLESSSDGGSPGTDGESGGSDPGAPPVDGDTEDAASAGDAGADTDNGSTDGGSGGLVPVTSECVENRDFVGQMFAGDGDPNHGGNPVTSPYPASYDSGLSALSTNKPPDGKSATVDLQIVGATVTATSYGDNASQRFWLQDGLTAAYVRMESPVTVGGEPVVVKVGSHVSAHVTGLRSYFGTLQIEAAEDWEFTGIDQDVYVDDRTGTQLGLEDDLHLVRVTGTLQGTPEPCGGSAMCWGFDFGGESAVRFRSASKFVQTGDCLTFLGPVSVFQGAVQLDTVNYNWLWNNSDR